MNGRKWMALALGGLLGLMTIPACGPQEKPAELVQLEEMRRAPESAEINGLAPDEYRKCTDLTNKAVAAWQDGEQEQARIYAELGRRQYITAQAKSSFQEADRRKQAAITEARNLEAKMDAMRTKADELTKSIDATKHRIAEVDPNNSELHIQLAMAERDKAVAVEAEEYQKATFREADAKLKNASTQNVKGERRKATQFADEARALFVKAYEGAKPEFDKKQAILASAERLKALTADAEITFGKGNVVTTDTRETILVLKGAFEKDKAELSTDAMDLLKKAAELLKRYPEATLRVEGFGQKASKNAQKIGQERADAARSFLVGQGVDGGKVKALSRGKTFLRFDEKKKENRALNDRVEVVILLQ